MPKLHHDTVVLGFAGEELSYRDGPDAEPRPLTFRDLAFIALDFLDPGEAMGPEMKGRIFGLTMKFFAPGTILDLAVEDAALVKDRAGKALNPLAYGRLCEWLEGDPQRVAGQ